MKRFIAVLSVFSLHLCLAKEPSIIERRLSPENEAIVQSVIKDMKIDFPVVAISNTGEIENLGSLMNNVAIEQFCNTFFIYIDEDYFDKRDYKGKRFIIAHELSHALCNHAQKKSKLAGDLKIAEFMIDAVLWFKTYEYLKGKNYSKYFENISKETPSFMKSCLSSFLSGFFYMPSIMSLAVPLGFKFICVNPVQKLISMFYSRRCELEADRKGALALGKDGIEGGISARTIAKMSQINQSFIQRLLKRLLSTHPTPDQRIDQLKNLKIN